MLWVGLSICCQSSLSHDQRLKNLTKTVAVRIFTVDETDSNGGSGVLISRSDGRYLVITNDHVVSDRQKTYQIQTIDNQIYHAQILSPPCDIKDNDLALLSFYSPNSRYSVLPPQSQVKTHPNESVIAGGFPFIDYLNQSPKFHSTQGKLRIVLDQPFIGGYQIGYTNLLRNGMSGGPVLNQQGELVGINGMAQEPLLGNPYIFQDGTSIEDQQWETMSRLSWAIPSQTIDQFVKKYAPK